MPGPHAGLRMNIGSFSPPAEVESGMERCRPVTDIQMVQGHRS
jgi:hypothetical protein